MVQVEGDPQAEQRPAAVFEPIEDKVKKWELIAAEEYRFDGSADGWDSDMANEETPEQKYIKVKPLGQLSWLLENYCKTVALP